MRGAVEPDALGLLQIALPEHRPSVLLASRKFLSSPSLPVSERLAFLSQRGAAVLLFALQRLTRFLLPGFLRLPLLVGPKQLHRGAMAGGNFYRTTQGLAKRCGNLSRVGDGTDDQDTMLRR